MTGALKAFPALLCVSFMSETLKRIIASLLFVWDGLLSEPESYSNVTAVETISSTWKTGHLLEPEKLSFCDTNQNVDILFYLNESTILFKWLIYYLT